MRSKSKLRTSNPNLRNLIQHLKTKAKDNDSRIWLDLSSRLSKSRRGRASVNLSRIQRCTKENDEIIVPGKVLGAGSINYPIKVAALSFSNNAKMKILGAQGKCLSIYQIIESNPKGARIKIIG